MSCENEICLDGVEYVRKDTMNLAVTEGLKYCIIRCYRAGVHAGFVVEKKSAVDGVFEVILKKTRRLWKWWSLDSTLSGIALHGPIKPMECKFGDELAEIELSDGCECIPCTKIAEDKIRQVPLWRQ